MPGASRVPPRAARSLSGSAQTLLGLAGLFLSGPILLPAGPVIAQQRLPDSEARTYPFELEPVGEIVGHLMEGRFLQVSGVFFDAAANELFVCDEKNGMIGIFDPTGTPVFSFGGARVMQEPRWVSTDADGSIWVVDGDRTAVQIFNYRGEPQDRVEFVYPATEDEPGGQVHIAAFAMDRTGAIYVADSDPPQVLVYEPDGALRLRVRSGPGGGDFRSITGLAVAPDGTFVVVDIQATPVQVFAKDGRRLSAFGERAVGTENFAGPVAAEFDEQGYLYVVDLLRHDVKVFDVQGRFQTYFGGWYSPETRGRSPGEMLYPSSITIAPGSDGLIYVGERFGSRVQLFRRAPRRTGDARPRLRIPDVQPRGR